MSYQIITDSSCDLGVDIAKAQGIKVVPFYVTFDGETYQKEIKEVGVREFYQKMIDFPDVFPKTSLPSIQDYLEVFRPYAGKGQDILCMCLSSKFSGSYNAAVNAREMILEEYPGIKIAVLDTALATVLQGLLVLEAVRMQQDGLSLAENVKNLERLKSTGRIIFTVGNFEYLIHGGRIGKVMGSAASTLGIKPLIMMKEGELFPTGIARSRVKARKKIIEQAKEYFEKTREKPEDLRLAMGYGYDREEAVLFRDQLLESMQGYSDINEIELYQIGATISVHTGPHPLGMGFLRKYDR